MMQYGGLPNFGTEWTRVHSMRLCVACGAMLAKAE